MAGVFCFGVGGGGDGDRAARHAVVHLAGRGRTGAVGVEVGVVSDVCARLCARPERQTACGGRHALHVRRALLLQCIAVLSAAAPHNRGRAYCSVPCVCFLRLPAFLCFLEPGTPGACVQCCPPGAGRAPQPLALSLPTCRWPPRQHATPHACARTHVAACCPFIRAPAPLCTRQVHCVDARG